MLLLFALHYFPATPFKFMESVASFCSMFSGYNKTSLEVIVFSLKLLVFNNFLWNFLKNIFREFSEIF